MNDKKAFSVSEALKFGFSKFIEHFFLFLKIIVTKVAIYLLTGLPFFIISFFFMRFHAVQVYKVIGLLGRLMRIFEIVLSKPLISLGFLLCVGLLIFVHVFLELGAVRIALDIYNKNTSTLSQLFSQSSKLWTGFLACILYGIICTLGFLFFIIPGIFFIVVFGLYKYIIVEQDKGAIESLLESYRLVFKAPLLIFILVCILTLLYLVTGPFSILIMTIGKLIYAFVYKRLKSGERSPETYATYDM